MEEKSLSSGYQLAWWGLVIGLISLVTLLSSPIGYRAGLYGHRSAFTIMEFAAYGGVSGIILTVTGFMFSLKGPRRAQLLAAAGFAASYFAFHIPWSLYSGAREFPAINDITTDTNNPPAFASLAQIRKSTGARIDYPWSDAAGEQANAYPDIKPLLLDKGLDAAFDGALDAANEMDWDISSSDKAAGRIEATDTTFWYGFKDDIVIRLTPVDSKTRLDVRSASRVGKGDAGKNAERIREYLNNISK